MQCGLCAVVAGLFRRAMCIAGSRRGSGESSSGCYQELPPHHLRHHHHHHHRHRHNRPHHHHHHHHHHHLHHLHQQQEQQQQEPVAVAAEDTPRSEEEAQRRTSEVGLDQSGDQNAFIQRISEDPSTPGKRSRAEVDEDDEIGGRLDELERQLLAKLDVSHYRPKHTGRFLTMHKRRRKRLVTRSLDQDPALLDDVAHGQVQCVLQRVTNWQFNAFTLETAAGGRSVPVLCVHLFHWYGLLDHFNLDVVRVWKLFTLIEEGYHSTNPYHNSIHAADVTQAMHCFLQESQIRRHLSYLEIMASLIAAVTHDLDHPGVNQPFLVATSNHLAALYENTSVLENHHWRSAVGCLLESGVSEQLPDEVKPELQRQISSLILATDITRQQEFLTRFKGYLDHRELDMREPEHRHFILQIALKCADISNPCRPWDISRKWSYKVCEEFFRQGDYERQLNLPVTTVCDRRVTSIPRIQVGFFKFVVLPLYEEWHRFLDDGFSRCLMRHLDTNQRHWEALIRQEDEEEEAAAAEEAARLEREAEEDRAAGIVIEEVAATELTIEAVEASENTEEDSGSVELTIPSPGLAPPAAYERDARRHSVPLGVCRSLSLAPRPTAAGRRESLPGGATVAARATGGGYHLAPTPPPARASSSRGSLHQRSEPSPTLTTSRGGASSVGYTPSVSPAAGYGYGGGIGARPPERPVSAENLLPDTSIASIANSLEASRLSSLVQQQQTWEQQLLEQQPSARQATLTRQQTFPPVQPYARMRYMSTTVEMSQCCAEALLEADSSSSRSGSPAPPTMTGSAAINSPEATAGHVVMDTLSPAMHHHGGLLSVTAPSSSGDLRRHSTPAQTRATSASSATAAAAAAASRHGHHQSHAPGTGRRFTTIPLTHQTGLQQHRRQQHEELLVGLAGHQKVFFIGSPPDSPPRLASATPSSDSGSGGISVGSEPIRKKSADSVSLPGNKRDYHSDPGREKASKILKLMKENVDPRLGDETIREAQILNNRRAKNQTWARRRGSAPVGLLSRLDDTPILNRTIESYSRRGSVPADITAHPTDRENYPFNNNNSNNNNNNNNSGSNNNGFSRLTIEGGGGGGGVGTALTTSASMTAAILSSRRGSVPADISELRRDLILGRGTGGGGGGGGGIVGGGKSRGSTRNSKKLLRRRSSGGPEMFASGHHHHHHHQAGPVDGNDNGGGGGGGGAAWLIGARSKRDLGGGGVKRDGAEHHQPTPVVVKRRGSLPIEMLAVTFPGRYIHR